jgi:AcrR family transcriptional regulator
MKNAARTPAPRRRKPQQARACARVEVILAAAESLLSRDGVGELTMRNISAAARAPVGSIYQYFSSPESVIRELIDRHHRKVGAVVARKFSAIRTFEQFLRAVDESILAAAAYFAATPGFREMWSGVRAWRDLRTMDVEDTLLNAQRMAQQLAIFLPNLAKRQLLDCCTVYCDSAGSVIRTTYCLERRAGKRLIDAHRSIVASHLRCLHEANVATRSRPGASR